jgi:serine/threonine-protein kinase/endoribonuclease IRE1
VKIADFGVCKQLESERFSFTRTSLLRETEGWMAPELELLYNFNNTGQRLDKSIDVFSLGCVFFYVLTVGGHPFGEKPWEKQANIFRADYNCNLDKLSNSDKLKTYNIVALVEIYKNRTLCPMVSHIPEMWHPVHHPGPPEGRMKKQMSDS